MTPTRGDGVAAGFCVLVAGLFLVAGCGPGTGSSPTTATPSASSPAPTLEVDLERGQVHVPGVGWLRADEFWDLYYNHPEKLPGDLDTAALAQLPGDPRRVTP
jgi:hypothetical protein